MKDKAERIDCPKCLEGYMVKIKGVQQCNQRCGNTLLPAAYEANRQKFLAAKKRRRTNNKKRSQFCCRCATKHMLDRSCEIEEILYLFSDKTDSFVFTVQDLLTELTKLRSTLVKKEVDPTNVGIEIKLKIYSTGEGEPFFMSSAQFYLVNEEEPITEEEQ